MHVVLVMIVGSLFFAFYIFPGSWCRNNISLEVDFLTGSFVVKLAAILQVVINVSGNAKPINLIIQRWLNGS